MKEPGEKICESCGSIVYPVWHRVDLSEEYGWVGQSLCANCNHPMFHVAGSPWFLHVMTEWIKEGEAKGLI